MEQVTLQASGVMRFQHLQYHGASSHLMGKAKLADLMLTFSSIFCFIYLIYGILFILLPYGITLISLECLVHMHLLRPHSAYQEFFFHLGCPCGCYAGVCWCENRNPPAREGKSPARLLIFCIIFWRWKAEQGGGGLALQTTCECCLCQWHEASWVALWQRGTVRWIGRHVVSVLECPGSWLAGVMEHAPSHALAFH